MAEFKYQEPFPIENDTTVYRLLTKDYVKTIECEGRKILKIEREGLELLAPVRIPVRPFVSVKREKTYGPGSMMPKRSAKGYSKLTGTAICVIPR